MKSDKPSGVLLVFAGVITCLTWPLAATLWFRHGEKALGISVFGLGLSLGPCLAAYAIVPRVRKQTARRVVLLVGGLSIMAFSLLGAVNLDMEGFFALVFAGTMGAAIGHNLVTVIVGPILFGRLLCGWGCWRAMILELLPIKHSTGRRRGWWTLMVLAGLATTISLAALSVFVLPHRAGGASGAARAASAELIAIGFGVYYAASIGLALALKDQRAFCKYLCPNAAILRVTSRPSLLRMSANRHLCNACGACSQICPMDIDVAKSAALRRPVASGDCILCQRCAHACPTGALGLTVGLSMARQTPFIFRT
jgi:polyferredoxin